MILFIKICKAKLGFYGNAVCDPFLSGYRTDIVKSLFTFNKYAMMGHARRNHASLYQELGFLDIL